MGLWKGSGDLVCVYAFWCDLWRHITKGWDDFGVNISFKVKLEEILFLGSKVVWG